MAKAKIHRRILVSPLNWGLGHATRLIPIIEELILQGHYVLLAGDGSSLAILRDAFPQLDWHRLPGFNISLSRRRSQCLQLLLQVPAFLSSIKKEHTAVKNVINQYAIDLIISDNRYGLYSKHVASVIITHQTNPYPGKYLVWMRPFTKRLSTRLLKHFDECWLPDSESKPKLSGTLSSPSKGLITKYLGYLSRINTNIKTNRSSAPDILVILSGPEPQRTLLETILIKQFKGSGLKTTMLCAQPERDKEQIENITLLPHCSPDEYYKLIMNSEHIICRSGYSTLMDLMVCQKTALLIPTPGQYEQEYLAKRASKLFGFSTISQNHIKSKKITHFLSTCSKTMKTVTPVKFKLPLLPPKK